MSRLRHPVVQVLAVIAVTLPWVGIVLSGGHLGSGPTVLISGIAVLGASFLLAWAAETAEKDVPRAFAIAVLAILAVAPEYAVDALYAWGAGSGGATAQACADLSQEAIQRAAEGEGATLAEACHDGNLAVANMTGANRILIGLGWSGIAVMTVWMARKTKDAAVKERDGFLNNVVTLDRSIATEIAFLAFATLWAFFVPLRGGIDAVDTLILVGIYATYILIVIRSGHEAHDEQVGVPKYFQQLPFPQRVAFVLGGFFYAGLMIFIAVKPFAHGLEAIGLSLGIPEFFMIQWIAPLASESPELIVVAVLVFKARSTAGFNALISSKLNQWTLLIGTISVVYSLAFGSYGVLPFDNKQALEIWITAGQSYFALAVLINLNISIREAIMLFVLFISQVLLEFLILRDYISVAFTSEDVLLGYTVLYLVAGTILFIVRRHAVMEVLGLTRQTVERAIEGNPEQHADHAD